jgi:hypothetical protein
LKIVLIYFTRILFLKNIRSSKVVYNFFIKKSVIKIKHEIEKKNKEENRDVAKSQKLKSPLKIVQGRG